jgi:hypothetical protein
VFPYYKARRSSSREKSPIDWRTIFEAMASIKEDLKEYFPYKTIEVDGAEADDVIGVLAQRDLDGKPNLIVSSDHDFQQLAMYANITQIAPVGKHKIVTEDPKTFLLEHIIKGDPGDGIPNILSSDDCIALGKRQIPMTAKKLAYYLRPFAYADASSEIRRNMDRNEQLISLAQIPSYITDKINDAFEVSPKGTRRNLLNYFISKKLKVLTASITDF